MVRVGNRSHVGGRRHQYTAWLVLQIHGASCTLVMCERKKKSINIKTETLSVFGHRHRSTASRMLVIMQELNLILYLQSDRSACVKITTFREETRRDGDSRIPHKKAISPKKCSRRTKGGQKSHNVMDVSSRRLGGRKEKNKKRGFLTWRNSYVHMRASLLLPLL